MKTLEKFVYVCVCVGGGYKKLPLYKGKYCQLKYSLLFGKYFCLLLHYPKKDPFLEINISILYVRFQLSIAETSDSLVLLGKPMKNRNFCHSVCWTLKEKCCFPHFAHYNTEIQVIMSTDTYMAHLKVYLITC